MNHWLETSKKNLIPLSEADSFREALAEWAFTGTVFDNEGKDGERDEIICGLCEHPELSYHFEIKNRLNGNLLLVGSSCILKFHEINILNHQGERIVDREERKSYLNETLKAKLDEEILIPLRKLWKAEKENRHLIESLAKRFKEGSGISPHELVFLFERMQFHEIAYKPHRYKISLRSLEAQVELSRMPKPSLALIEASLSHQQRKKFMRLFSEN